MHSRDLGNEYLRYQKVREDNLDLWCCSLAVSAERTLVFVRFCLYHGKQNAVVLLMKDYSSLRTYLHMYACTNASFTNGEITHCTNVATKRILQK